MPALRKSIYNHLVSHIPPIEPLRARFGFLFSILSSPYNSNGFDASNTDSGTHENSPSARAGSFEILFGKHGRSFFFPLNQMEGVQFRNWGGMIETLNPIGSGTTPNKSCSKPLTVGGKIDRITQIRRIRRPVTHQFVGFYDLNEFSHLSLQSRREVV